jgi:hypothetical protein
MRRERGVELAKPIQIQSAKEATMATTKENSGVLFKNTDKAEGSNQPDWTGDLRVGSVRYRLGAWVKEGARGKFLSLSVRKDEPGEVKPAAKKLATVDDNFLS